MTPAQRGRSYHHGDLRRALLGAAGEMLERDGPEAISFRAVARASGVSQTAPYNHFKNKEDLLATLAGDGFLELASSQRAAAAATRAGEARVKALALCYLRFAMARPQLYRLMFGVGISDWRDYPGVLETKAECFGPIKAALAEHLAAAGKVKPDTIETAAIASWALVHGLSMLLLDRSLDPDKKSRGGLETLIERVVSFHAKRLKTASIRR